MDCCTGNCNQGRACPHADTDEFHRDRAFSAIETVIGVLLVIVVTALTAHLLVSVLT